MVCLVMASVSSKGGIIRLSGCLGGLDRYSITCSLSRRRSAQGAQKPSFWAVGSKRLLGAASRTIA